MNTHDNANMRPKKLCSYSHDCAHCVLVLDMYYVALEGVTGCTVIFRCKLMILNIRTKTITRIELKVAFICKIRFDPFDSVPVTNL